MRNSKMEEFGGIDMQRLLIPSLVILLFTTHWLHAEPIKDEKAPDSSKKPLLGFDPKQIEPPDSDKGMPLARVFYEYIYPSDMKAESPTLTETQARQLLSKILRPLFRRYAEQNKITATPEEIDQFHEAMERILKQQEFDAVERLKPRDEENDQEDKNHIAEHFVVQWKLSKALYEKYGGEVIFQQGNPFEPVGAYRDFLEELEEGQVFEIFHAHNRKEFWHYFTRDHSFEIPPEDVNYEKPWWLQKQVQE